MEDLELVEEFLLELKKEYREGDEESVKVAELRKIEQKGKTMEEFVQEFCYNLKLGSGCNLGKDLRRYKG